MFSLLLDGVFVYIYTAGKFFGGVKGGKTIDSSIKRFIIGVAVVSVLAAAVMAYFILDSQGKLEFEGDPDLVVGVAVKPNPASPGDTVEYVYTIRNQGQGEATGVFLNNPLPDSLEFKKALPGPPACTESGHVVSCNLGTMPGGSTASINVTAKVIDSVLGDAAELQISNKVSVLSKQEKEPRDNNYGDVLLDIKAP